MIVALAFVVGAVLGASIGYWIIQNTMRAQLTAQRKQLDQNHRLMGEMEQSHETRMRKVVTSIKQKHEEELEEQIQPLDEQIQALQRKHQDELNDLAQDHWNTLEAFQTERYLEISNLKQEHSAGVTALHEDIIGMKRQFQQDMKSVQRQFQGKLEHEIESARAQFQVVVDKFIQDHQTEITQLKQQHQEEIAILKGEVPASGPTKKNAPRTSDSSSESLPSVTTDASFEAPPETIPKETKMPPVAPVTPSAPPDPFLTTIQMMGQSKKVAAIGQLEQQAKRAETEGKVAIAIALGQIAEANPQSPALQKAIPSLTKLSQDIKPTVRQAAVEALGNIPSAKAVPVVKRALRDPDAKVVKAANQAMEKLKPFRKTTQIPQKRSSYFS